MPNKIGPRRAFKHYIAEHREALNLTQDDLANRLGSHVMTISRWENYKTRVDVPSLAAIAEALYGGLGSAEDLLHHPDRPTANQLMRRMAADDRNHFMKQLK